MGFLLQILIMDSYINWFSNIEPALQSHSKPHLVMLCYNFYVLLQVFGAKWQEDSEIGKKRTEQQGFALCS